MRDLTYPPIIATCKVLFRGLGLTFQLAGTEHVPRTGGALVAFNHVSYLDFIFGGYAAQPSGRLIRFMAKRETFDHPVSGPLMRSMHHISVDRAEGAGSMMAAIDYLKRGEVVGIFPEATISRSFEIKELKSGATRIAADAGVPLIPAVLWGTQRIMTKDHPRDLSRNKTIAVTVGAPLHPTGKHPVAETAALHDALASLLDETVAAYPPGEQPPGSWWLPARFGGSAPTPAAALDLDRDEMRRRAEKRAAQRAAKGGSASR
jgi:1-acyl-sn-glycerol-3-phosphate acyltransferase